MDKNKISFETNSFIIASTLISLGIPLDSLVKDADGKATFIFTRTDNLELLLQSFWKRSLKVEPNSFFEAQRFLKSRIYGDD